MRIILLCRDGAGSKGFYQSSGMSGLTHAVCVCARARVRYHLELQLAES